MNYLDFIVLGATLILIVLVGVWQVKKQHSIQSFLLGDKSMRWGTIGLSVMATQASAITFISTPGQAYESGLSFVQNYFGLPFALIIVSAVFIPIYYKLKVYTAYEYLESRFDIKTRMLGAFLFLVQRGLAAGITIYAPAIILSSILGWNLNATIFLTGISVIIYTVTGGTTAVSITQKYQMGIIMVGMFAAFFIAIKYITQNIPMGDAMDLASSLGKLNAVDFDLNFEKRYTIWSGLAGGLFLALSYFGTDQSQVQRYLAGKNVTASRMGLMFNAMFKVPMQFFILFTGVLVYIFYVFYQPPVHFKEVSMEMLRQSPAKEQLLAYESEYVGLVNKRKELALEISKTENGNERASLLDDFKTVDSKSIEVRNKVKSLITEVSPDTETKDSDYVFLTFVMNYLPNGLIGLLIAVILSAAMSSTSSELNALASTSAIDFYKRLVKRDANDRQYLFVSRVLTLFWGGVALSFAIMATNTENLIEAINIIGSIFYGTILGIFIIAFLIKYVKGSAVFYGALIAQAIVFVVHFLIVAGYFSLGYLWYNVIGFSATILFSIIIQSLLPKSK
ncbi:MAG: sodium:solute symporter [Cyclobacteriaceae bacterium]|nr:sodium:solute symporter [Cyclobacteriaceae bacterium SS2]